MSTMYLTQALHRALRYHPQRFATVFGPRRTTFAQFIDRVARLAGALKQIGMNSGDRVGILALNSDRFLELYFAIWWAGGVVNPINIRWSAREIVFSLDDCDTHVLAVDEAFAPMVTELSERSQALRTIIYMGSGEARSGMFGFEDLIAAHAPAADALRCNDDLAGVFYTGGTTGFAKGVMLSHANLFTNALMGLCEGIADADDVGLHVAPMFHLADGFFAIMLAMRGCTQVISPSFQPEQVLRTIQTESVTTVLLVPTMIQMLIDYPRWSEFRADSLNKVIYGASPISESVLDRAMQRLPNVRFMQAYGQTEMSPAVTFLRPEHHDAEGRRLGKHRSAGRPLLGVEVKIVDGHGLDVVRGAVGEIAARGPGVMLGYWNKPAETAAVLRDGWMHSGDAGYMDDEGFIYIVDRLKDMIVSGGENVYSAEVESAIAKHPGVATCAVIGIPDPKWGEAVHAVIVRRAGAAEIGVDEIRDHCRQMIAGYKCPRSVEFRDALPVSGAGKVLKSVLREPYWKQQSRRVG
ncbi:MAG TPA: long-chain fatty acid--CoA ligase [Steroidobacteraceae bacterium]